MYAAIDVIFITNPPPFFLISGKTCFVISNGPKKFVLNKLQKDKIKHNDNFYVFTGSSVGVVPILGKGIYKARIDKLGSVSAKII